METIRVIIVDEQPLFRQGIRCTLEQMKDCVIIGETTDANDVFELARTATPDVALIDAGLTSADALELARQMRHLGGLGISACVANPEACLSVRPGRALGGPLQGPASKNLYAK